MAGVEKRLDRIEGLLGDLILMVGTLKSSFEEEKEQNDKRLKQIDRKFEQIDLRFEEIETRMDRRFEQMDERFEQLEARMDRRFEQMDRRFDEVMLELGENKREHEYMASRLFRAEMELENLRKQMGGSGKEV